MQAHRKTSSRLSSFFFQTVKKVRNRQNQSPNSRRVQDRSNYGSQTYFRYFSVKTACFARILTYCAAVSDDAKRGALRMRRAPCGCIATRDLPVAVPKICAPRLRRLQILTAATPFCSLHPPPAALANVPVPMYADGRELLAFRTFLQSDSVSKKVFDTLRKTSSRLSSFFVFRTAQLPCGTFCGRFSGAGLPSCDEI